DLLVATSFRQNKYTSITEDAYGFGSDALIANPSAASNFSFYGASYTLYHYNGVQGRIGYNWKEKYIINITGSRDGSSRFGPGKQFGNFGSVGGAWIFSNEKFVQHALPFISFGKLRLSYGSTGNDQIQDYQYLSLYNPNSTTYQGITQLIPVSLTNPYFAWE